MDQIGAIVYINLYFRTDRKKELEAEFDRLSIDRSKIHRVPGVVDENSATGCHMAHIDALRFSSTLDPDIEYILFLEDDFSFIEDVQFVHSSLEKLFQQDKNSWDVAFLAYNVKKRTDYSGDQDLLSIALSSSNAAAYLVKRSYIRSIIQNLEEGLDKYRDTGEHWKYVNDVYWDELKKDKKWVYFNSPLGHQRKSWSDNGGGVHNHLSKSVRSIVSVYLFHYNSTTFIEVQVKLLRKFLVLKNTEELRVFGMVDSDDDRMREQMRKKWLDLQVEPIEMPRPHMGGAHPMSFGLAVKHVFDNYVVKNDHISMVLENDVLLVAPFRINEYCKDYQVCGDIRFNPFNLPARISHFFLGLMIINHKKFTDVHLFDPRMGDVYVDGKGYWTDGGAGTYYWLLEHKKDTRPIHTEGPHVGYKPFEAPVCIVHNVTDDVQYLPPTIDKEGYKSWFRSVNYENTFLHMERMSEYHQYDKQEKVRWALKMAEDLLNKC